MRQTSVSPATPAFRTLSARLLARRLRMVDLRLAIAITVLVVCVTAFVYWQVRVPLDGTVRHHGMLAGVRFLSAVLVGCVLAAAALAAERQTALAGSPPGPEWLALPVEPAHVERHLARESSAPALSMFVPATAAWLTGLGLLSALWLAVLALAFPLAWWLAVRASCFVALRRAVAADGPARTLPAAWRALVSARHSAPVARRTRPVVFRTLSRWRSLAHLDAVVSLRAGSPRARLAGAALALAASIAVWFVVRRDPLETRALSFAAFTLACTGLGAWAAWRAAGDPASAVRPLPITLGDAWRARAFPLLLVLAGVLALQMLAAQPLPPLLRIGTALTWAFPALLVLFIGLHLGLSMPGRPDAAEGLYYGWLGVGLVSSLAIPLFGWGMLIGALIFATRRIGRWNTPEVV